MSRRGREKVGGGTELCCKDSNLTDDTILDVPIPSHGELSFESVDFSMNALSAQGLQCVVDICRRCRNLRVLKLYKNRFGDDAAPYFSSILKHCPSLQEIHVSHNRFTAEGAEMIIRAADRHRPESSTPLWLRLEQNQILDPDQVFLRLLEDCKLSICARKDKRGCSNSNCAFAKKVHLPHFEFQVKPERGSHDDSMSRTSQKSTHFERQVRTEGRSKDRSMTRPVQKSRSDTAFETEEPPQTPANDSQPDQHNCLVQGLPEFLAELKLEMYLQDIVVWAEKMGAAFLNEIVDNADELAEDLGLKPLEKKRLLQNGPKVCRAIGPQLDFVARPDEQERVEVDTFWSDIFQERLEDFKQTYRGLRRTQMDSLQELESDNAHAQLYEVEALEVTDIDDVGGVPLYILFKKEDWVLLEIKYQLHLLVHAFALRPREPDEYPGIPLAHVQLAFEHIFRKPLEPQRFGLDGLDKLIGLVDDAVGVNSDLGALQPLQRENMSIDWFVKSTEDRRRHRQNLVDAGDEAAQLTMDTAGAKPSCRPELPLPCQHPPSYSDPVSQRESLGSESNRADPREPLRRRKRRRVRARRDSRSPSSAHDQKQQRRVFVN